MRGRGLAYDQKLKKLVSGAAVAASIIAKASPYNRRGARRAKYMALAVHMSIFPHFPFRPSMIAKKAGMA